MDLFYNKHKICMFLNVLKTYYVLRSCLYLEGPSIVMFVRMMLVRLINVSFARIMPIWFVAILKQMKATVNQLRASLAPKMFVFNINPIYNPYYFKWAFLNVFCLFAKTFERQEWEQIHGNLLSYTIQHNDL